MKKLIDSFKTSNASEVQAKLDSFAMGMFLVVMGAGTMLAAWLLIQDATKRAVISEIATATRQGNIHTLSQKTDWASVRNWMKQDLKERGGQNAQNADQIVDYYVRPENLPSLLYFYNTAANHVRPEAFVRDARFSGITQMTIEFAAPPQFDKPWMDKLEPVRAVFELDGLDWKLKRIDAPDYLIPAAPKVASNR